MKILELINDQLIKLSKLQIIFSQLKKSAFHSKFSF